MCAGGTDIRGATVMATDIGHPAPSDACTVSVIIPVFNAAPFLQAALDSALGQGLSGVEIIVVDDGSTDESLSIARRFEPAVTVLSQPNRGSSAARNAGARIARGQYLVFLDADDFLLPGALAAQYGHGQRLPAGQILYGRASRLTDHTGCLHPHSDRDAKPDNSDSLANLLLDPPVVTSVLYPKPLFDAMGGFAEDLLMREDYDLFARILLRGHAAIASPVSVFVYRDHSTPGRVSRRRSVEAFQSQHLMFARQIALLRECPPGATRDDLTRGLAATIWISARTCLRAGYRTEAKALFDLARSLHTPGMVKGSVVYRALTALAGPMLAEAVLDRVKALRS